jgi:hypothetical protein
MVGFKDPRDVATLNKLLEKLNRNKADARYILGNRIKDVVPTQYNLNIDDVVIRVTSPGSTITLPKATSSGKIYWVKNTSGGNVTLKAATGELVEGANTMTFADKVCRQVIDIQNGAWDVI